MIMKLKLATNENFLAIETTTLIPANPIIGQSQEHPGQSGSKPESRKFMKYEPTVKQQNLFR